MNQNDQVLGHKLPSLRNITSYVRLHMCKHNELQFFHTALLAAQRNPAREENAEIVQTIFPLCSPFYQIPTIIIVDRFSEQFHVSFDGDNKYNVNETVRLRTCLWRVFKFFAKKISEYSVNGLFFFFGTKFWTRKLSKIQTISFRECLPNVSTAPTMSRCGFVAKAWQWHVALECKSHGCCESEKDVLLPNI